MAYSLARTLPAGLEALADLALDLRWTFRNEGEDETGKRMIADWIAFANCPEARARVVFLEDYDLELAAEMVQGVDVWVNTPRRPWEACGTSA